MLEKNIFLKAFAKTGFSENGGGGQNFVDMSSNNRGLYLRLP